MSPNPTLDTFCSQRRTLFYPKSDLPAPDAALVALRSLGHDELGLTPARIAEVAHRVLGRRPASVEPLEQQGTFHRLFRLRLADRTLIFRANAAGEHFRDFLLHQEDEVAAFVGARGIPVPQVLHTDTTRRHCPWDFQIVETAPGRSLRELDDDEPATLRLLEKLGELLAAVHQLPLEGYGFLDVRPLVEPDGSPRLRGIHASWSQYLLLRLDEHIDYCARREVITAPEAEQIRRLFTEEVSRLDQASPVLLHGDPGSHNVFTDGSTLTALIDWEDCLAGDAVYEIAFWATFHPARRHRAFLDGYAAGAALPTDFPTRFWLYFLRVALAKTVHRFRFGYRDLPGRPPAAGRIRHALGELQALAVAP